MLPENARVHTVYTNTNFKQLLRFQLEEYHNQIHDNDKTFYFKKAYCWHDIANTFQHDFDTNKI